MLTQEKNQLLTQVGPGTPAGALMRRYWQPAALSEELPAGGAPLAIRLFGEDLVLFRDESGQPGLLGIHCSHRGADLSYGRIEDGGLRCLYHGWLYDRTGRCLEQPGEEAGSTFHARIRHLAYPCQEQGGLIFAYLGPGEPPLLPGYEFLRATDEQRVVTKIFQECSYLQGNEGNQDPVHLSFLHQARRDEVAGRAARTSLMAQDPAPTIDLEMTDWGLRIYAVRQAGPDTKYVRLTNMVLPNLTCFGGYQDGYSINWHVAIDDTHHWKYMIVFRRGGPIDKQQIMQMRAETTPTYHLVRNKANRYLQDREEMTTRTFTGMGPTSFEVHDAWATESAGPIQDRTTEHLTPRDVAIIQARQLLLAAIEDVQAARDPRNVVRSPADNHYADLVLLSQVIPLSVDHRTFWKQQPRELAPLELA